MEVGQKFDPIQTGFDFHLTSFRLFSGRSTNLQTCSNGPNIRSTNLSKEKLGWSKPFKTLRVTLPCYTIHNRMDGYLRCFPLFAVPERL